MKSKSVVTSITMTCIKITLYIIIVICLFKLGQASFQFGSAIFTQEAMTGEPGTDITVTIKEGTSTYKIGQLLERKGLVEDAKLFFVQEYLSEYKGEIKPGSYVLNTSYTVDKMLSIMARQEEEETEH